MYRLALHLLRDPHDANDAAQESLVKILRTLDRFDERRSFRAWIFQITRNTCIDEHRRRKRQAWDEAPELADPAPSPVHLIAKEQSAVVVRRALQQLAPLYREVLVLYHFEHLKYAEIADVLQIPLGTVMNRIFRARQKFKELLPEGGERP